ncbi:hypothetical protein BBI09_03665 [Stutzerimonas xanthomarina]|nr:hypothetical protein BBI09_03665 [Stutzerimonas xanthomarina]
MEAQGGTLKDGFEFTNGKLSVMSEVRQKVLLGVILSGSIGTLSGVEDTAGTWGTQGSVELLTQF